MEDKIIGPLTLPQFFYLLFGGLIIWLLHNWTLGSPLRILFWLIALPIGVLSIALAFVKVQERPFIFFLASLMTFMRRPRQRIWQRGSRPNLVKIVEATEDQAPEAPHKAFDRERVSEIAKNLDTLQPGGREDVG